MRIGHALVQTIRDPGVLECVRTCARAAHRSEGRSTSLVPGRIFEVNVSPMPGGGAVAVLHDITRIEQVERTQRDFVANVSHELRTPLTSISGYVETLLDHEASLSQQAREFLTTILKNATRMNRLTEDLLVMARVESSEQELHPAPIPADVLVRDAVQAMSGLVQDTEAVLEIGEITTAEVVADTDAILQVLSNLIENGIKYGQARNEPYSRIIVSAREVSEPDRSRGVQRPRFRLRHRLRAPQPNLRALLPGRQGALPGVRRHGPGPGDCTPYGADAWRLHPGRKRAERRKHLHIHTPKGLIFCWNNAVFTPM